jgi:glutamyl-Q tRNA(Asp) synthetase
VPAQGRRAAPAPAAREAGCPTGQGALPRRPRYHRRVPLPPSISRFAPSITGEAHPGTLLSALLCWLDTRSRGGKLILRLEDLDTTRLRPGWSEAMRGALDWFGLDWDAVQAQHALAAQHEAALDALADAGLLYPCRCSRTERRAGGRQAPDGGWAYPNTCRDRPLPPGGWRTAEEPLRVRLSDERIELVDEAGVDLSQSPAAEMGDPVVRRRDRVLAYHLVVVVDDAASAVDRIVRGRDLATATATQIALQRRLGIAQPTYRHHLLLLEPQGGKLAKLHGSVGYSKLRDRYDAAELCGILAAASGLRADATPCRPEELLREFDWGRVGKEDRMLAWSEAGGLTLET